MGIVGQRFSCSGLLRFRRRARDETGIVRSVTLIQAPLNGGSPRERMNIVHINTADIQGGAARATYALHRGLLAAGHQSRMLVGYKYSTDPTVAGIWFYQNLFGRGVQRFVKAIEERSGLQYLLQPFRQSFLRHPFVRNADVIHLHNLHGNYFSFTILPALSRIAPLVWTLYDCWPMTGHCTYPTLYDCRVWEKGEGKCPALFDYPPIGRDTEAYLWKKKQQAYRDMDCSVVGPSEWMCAAARQSPLLQRFPLTHIPQGIDTNFFHIGSQSSARKRIDIPLDATVVMVSALPDAPRKGLPYFLASLRFLTTQRRLWILVVGSRGLIGPLGNSFSIREMGYIDDPDLWRECFRAADVYALPTLADNLPLTILESLSCGTPVVAFDVGGVKEVVRTGQTGYCAREKDAEDLARGIALLLNDRALRMTCSKNAQHDMRHSFSLDQQVRAYSRLYEQCQRI